MLVLGVGWQQRRRRPTATGHGLLHPWVQSRPRAHSNHGAGSQSPWPSSSPQRLSEKKKVARANPASATYCGRCLHSQLWERALLRVRLLFIGVLLAIVEPYLLAWNTKREKSAINKLARRYLQRHICTTSRVWFSFFPLLSYFRSSWWIQKTIVDFPSCVYDQVKPPLFGENTAK